MNQKNARYPAPRKPKAAEFNALQFGRVPPQRPALEAAVLGAVMLERDKLNAVVAILPGAEVLYVDAHQKIYAAILRLEARNMPIDILTVTANLREAGELELVGGAFFVTQLTRDVVTAANVEAHARLVMEAFVKREIIRQAGEALVAAYEESTDAFDLLDQVSQDIAAIGDHFRTGTITSFGSALDRTLVQMEEAAQKGGDLVGLSTHLAKLNEITSGLSGPDLITVAAGTGEGKTTLALNIAEHMATAGTPVGFFSLEMRDRQLVWKVLSRHLREPIKNIRRGAIGSEKWDQLKAGPFQRLRSLPLFLYDRGGLNISELKAIARIMVRKHSIKALFLDYVQLVQGVPGKKYGTREEEVNHVSKQLKALAMELDIPIVMLSQLNRIEKQNAKRMYKLSDLRESGALEQDSDGVVFIYRPTEHDQTEMLVNGESMEFTEMDALIDIAKWRLGETGLFRVRFDGAFNRFSDHEPAEPTWHSGRPDSPRAGIQGNYKLSVPTTPPVPSHSEPHSAYSEDKPF